MSKDGGRTLSRSDTCGRINGAPERAVLATEKCLYALDGRAEYVSPGVYRGRSWRSADNLKTIQQERPLFYIPDGIKPREDVEKWFGLFVYRTILEMPDGSWLMTMYGNFTGDTLLPANKDAVDEVHFMMRTIIVTSSIKDRPGICPRLPYQAGEPVGGICRTGDYPLKDGRLLCIMNRHHYPLMLPERDPGKT
jgi:hypothetical protein